MQQMKHRRDLIGFNKIEEAIRHYKQYSLKMWLMRIMIIGLFLLIGVYW